VQCGDDFVTIVAGAGRACYRVSGNGGKLRASVTLSDRTVANEAVVTVIVGSCDVCEIVPLSVVGNVAVWPSKIGVEYLVLVQAKSEYVYQINGKDECKTPRQL
jgi:hypothetical protein